MIRLSSPKILTFEPAKFNDLGDASNIIETKVKDLAIELYSLNIEPTRLNQLQLNILYSSLPKQFYSVRVFFFSNLSSWQSELIELNSNFKEKNYLSKETDFWNGYPFIVDKIAFAPNDIKSKEKFTFTVNIFKKN